MSFLKGRATAKLLAGVLSWWLGRRWRWERTASLYRLAEDGRLVYHVMHNKDRTRRRVALAGLARAQKPPGSVQAGLSRPSCPESDESTVLSPSVEDVPRRFPASPSYDECLLDCLIFASCNKYVMV